jgi:hypothetical protein
MRLTTLPDVGADGRSFGMGAPAGDTINLVIGDGKIDVLLKHAKALIVS